MKPQKGTNTIILLLALAAMLLWGCKISSGGSPVQSGSPVPSGSGALANPAVKLDALKSYHASLRQNVTGSLDGQPFEYHTRIEISRRPGQIDSHVSWVEAKNLAIIFTPSRMVRRSTVGTPPIKAAREKPAN